MATRYRSRWASKTRKAPNKQNLAEQKLAEEQLKEREEQYRSIFEVTSDGLVIADLDSAIVVEANPTAWQMFGYLQEEFIGLDSRKLIHPDYVGIAVEFARVLKAGKQVRRQAICLHKDGTPFYVEIFVTGFVYKGKPHIMGVTRNVTEQVQSYQLLEQRVAERTRELSTLLEISRNLTSTLQLKPLLYVILDQLKLMLNYSGSGIVVMDGEEMVLLAARRPTLAPGELPPALRFGPANTKVMREDILGQGGPVIIGNVRDNTPLAYAYRQFVGEHLATTFDYVRSWLGVPIEFKGRLIGVLSLSHHEPEFFSSSHAALAFAVANQAASAIENARLYEQAQVVAALEERQRLARELHDSVSQALFGITLGINTTRILLERDLSRVPQSLDYIYSLAQSGMTEMRALLFELRPESLETEGLVVALTKQAAAIKSRYGLEVQVELGAEPTVPLPVKEALYRIGQESMHNTVKHAQASRITLRLLNTAEQLRLEISDDGIGFEPQGDFPGHLGLRSMHERASKLGGKFLLRSHPGHGTQVVVEVPLNTSQVSEDEFARQVF